MFASEYQRTWLQIDILIESKALALRWFQIGTVILLLRVPCCPGYKMPIKPLDSIFRFRCLLRAQELFGVNHKVSNRYHRHKLLLKEAL